MGMESYKPAPANPGRSSPLESDRKMSPPPKRALDLDGSDCTSGPYICVRVAVCCSVLQCVAGGCSELPKMRSILTAATAPRGPLRVCVLQCVAVCCSVLQCVAVCRSVLQ